MNFEEIFKSWTLEQKVEWALGPNIFNLSNQMRSIIVDLKNENERLKGEVRRLNVKLSDESNNATILAEKLNEINHSHEQLRKENAKLRCLALHGMIGYAVCKMNLAAEKYKDDEMSGFAVPIEFSKWHRKEIEWTKAYRKAKKELKEGK